MSIIIGIIIGAYICAAMVFTTAGISYERKADGGSWPVAVIFGLAWPLMVLHYLTVVARR